MFGGYVLFQSTQEPVTLLIVSHVLERDGKKRWKNQNQTLSPELSLVSHCHTKSRVLFASLGSSDRAFCLLLSYLKRYNLKGQTGQRGLAANGESMWLFESRSLALSARMEVVSRPEGSGS
jgi:hypothetical protein